MLQHRFALSLIAIAAVAFASDAAAFIVYKVGGDADCPYTSIQDAVDAAAANPGTDDIWIAMNASYTGQQVNIVDQDVVIEGGFTDCDDIDIDTAETTVSGAGNAGGAVFTIRGTSNVYFSNLFITGASRDGDASGGGIDFDGSGSVELHESTIGLNSAGYGGGINMHGDGGHADLTLDNDMVILNNTAYTSGGGIRIEGDTRLYVLQPNTLIDGNHAQGGYGGGIEVLGPARADIGSPGYGDLGVIFFNDAQYGGGIAVLGTEAGRGHVADARLFTTDGANPVQLSNNFAAAKGGAIYLKPLAPTFIGGNDSSGTRACAFDYRIDDNGAPDGAAIYADWDTNEALEEDIGSVVYLNGGDTCGPESPGDLGAVPCAQDAPCNEMSRNIAADANAQPTAGAAILVGNTGFFYANRLIMRGNEAGTLFTGYPGGFSGSLIELNNCLVGDNHTQHELMHAANSQLHFYNCTVSHNTIDNGYVFYAEDGENVLLRIIDDIIDEPGVLTLDYPGDPARVTVANVLSNDVSTLPPSADVMEGAPTFVDAANGDYHLQLNSLGVDFAPTGTGIDLDGRTRTVDLPGVPNTIGPLDLGAYEIQVDTVLGCANADTIFCDGFDG